MSEDSSAMLLEAVESGDLDGVRQALRAGADVHQLSEFDSPLVIYAYRWASREIAFALLDAGASADAADWEGMSLLMRAVQKGLLQDVRKLIALGASLDSVDERGHTALHTAVMEGQLEIFELLMESGAAPDTSSKTGRTPLMSGAFAGQVEVCKTLLDIGADPTLSDDLGWTPLRLAARSGNPAVLRPLLDAGARINGRSRKGSTALLAAVAEGSAEMVRELRSQGADTTVRDDDGWGAIRMALEFEHPDLIALLRELDAPSLPREDLSCAAVLNDPAGIRAAIGRGASIDEALLDKGQTPLILAVCAGHVEAVVELLSHGPDLQRRCKDKQAALDHALIKGHTEVVGLLTDAGATASARTWNRVGRKAFRGGDFEAGYTAFSRIPPEERSADIWGNLGQCAGQIGRHEEARDAVLASEALEPLTTPRLHVLCYCHYEAGRWAQMLAAAKKAVALDPKDVYGWQQLGIAQERLGLLDAAAGSNDRALELSPANPHLLCNRALVRWRMEQTVDIEAFAAAFDKEPKLVASVLDEPEQHYRGLCEHPDFKALLSSVSR